VFPYEAALKRRRKSVKRIAVLSIAALFVAAPLIVPAAQAAGCIKGAIAGGVAGHYVAHHGWIGAGIGCVVGHHEAVKRDREDADPAREEADPDRY
jgi:hypothetical protein